MSLFKNIFGKKEEPITSYSDFWTWFQNNEKTFYHAVKNTENIEKRFFDKLSQKLDELKDGYYFLTGMYDEDVVELVFTTDGDVKNIVFIEELVDCAPKIDGWKFTALKPSIDIENLAIDMDGIRFDSENLFFYSNENDEYPDLIDISVTHNDCTERNKRPIENGIYIFLENYLGELDFANNVDNLEIIAKSEVEKELVPIEKLKAFLAWRQKEFIEKYEGLRYDTQNDAHSVLEAKVENGGRLLAVVNSELLKWDSKASHPWVGLLTLKFEGNINGGMPSGEDFQRVDEIEDVITAQLKDFEGYLYIGRQTADSEREIYFACKDYRLPAKMFYQIQLEYSDQFEISYEMYKDKYWQSFERFRPN